MTHNIQHYFKSLLHRPLIAAALLTLAACGGDDGKPGQPGDPGGVPAVTITALNVEIMDLGLKEGLVFVKYRVTNQDDEVVIGIPSATFIAAQLLPQGYTGAGNATAWQYFTAETCAATCPGTYTDLKTGIYTYTFSAPLNGMNGQTFMDGATERLVIKLGGDALPDGTPLPVINTFKDWSSTGTIAYTRDIVGIESCNACHNNLAFHGGKYNQVQTCVTCHNLTKISSPSNVFAPMVHGKHLTGYPQPLSDCESCHKPDPMLVNNQDWNSVPTIAACGSCHTNINFPAGEGHPAQENNSNCVACHNSEWTIKVHSGGNVKAALANFKAEIVSANVTGTTASIGVKLTNPETGEVYGATNTLPFVADLRVYANWGGNVDYTTGNPSNIRLQSTSPSSGENGVFNYSISGLVIPPGSETDTGTFAIQGKVCATNGKLVACGDGVPQLVIKSTHSFFNTSSLTATGRRVVVTNETCGSCHGDQQLNFHGSRNDLEQQCQLCHNHNRQADATAPNPSLTTIDYKQLIHALHRGKYAGFEGLDYPGNIGNCAQCHTKNDKGVLTAALPLPAGVPPLALNNGTYTSATSAICANCHQSDTAKEHMIQQGGVFAGTLADATAGTETCAVCHGQGSVADVLKVHPIK